LLFSANLNAGLAGRKENVMNQRKCGKLLSVSGEMREFGAKGYASVLSDQCTDLSNLNFLTISGALERETGISNPGILSLILRF
jgi:hypothetical protein